MQQSFFLLICTIHLHSTMGARILGVFAHPVRSNALYTHAVMDTLATAGHDVTVYSHFKPESGYSFKHVYIHADYAASFSYDELIDKLYGVGFGGSAFRIYSHYKCDKFLQNPLVQQLIHSDETFDLIFTGSSFAEESTLVFGHIFKAPVINLLPSGTWSTIDYVTGNSIMLSYSPEYLVYPFTDRMSFFERVKNFLSGTVSLLYLYLYDLPGHDAIIKRHVPSLPSPPPPVYKMATDVALTFINVHPLLSYPKPLPPNIVMIGGIHIRANNQSLPDEIQELMDNAKEGVIFCSLGTLVPVDTMPRHIIQAFVDSFKQLPYKVIWKISAKTLPELPDNVFVSSWLPQLQILEHPNLKVFFTHGGLGSMLEVLRVGVPVVGLPFTTDQPFNVKLIEHLGVGVGLRLENLSEQTITTALKTVIYNNSYAQNARRLARLYADRPMEPKDLVVYWTNYVLKHGGAHLRPQAALMPWYQRHLLDVAAIVTTVIIIVAMIGIAVMTMIYRCTMSKCWQIKLKKA